MLRTTSCTAALACFLFPASLIAGGPPWLCLPIDGVTSVNAKACSDLLTRQLESKAWQHDREVQLQQHANQWYLTFSLGKPVELGDVEAALRGSGFSIPRDRLRLFGHVILEIDARSAPHKELLADLEALDYVSVAKSEESEDSLLVTVDMPYPHDRGGPNRKTVRWDRFQRNDFASDPATRSEPAATAATLPGYDDFRHVAARHKAALNDIRWSPRDACRPLGGVAEPKKKSVAAEAR